MAKLIKSGFFHVLRTCRYCVGCLFLLWPLVDSYSQVAAFSLPFEADNNTTPTYQEVIELYRQLSAAYPQQLFLQAQGETDSGYPLHTAVLSLDGDVNPVSIRQKGKAVLLVNNAIHPGEPCGVDASMLWLRDYLQDAQRQEVLQDLVIVVIPFYNIGGGLNRGSYSRANQLGPREHGFRGNARNLDLNRDFIKCDSRNAQTFNRIFHYWQPDVMIDNHTSNGADYQYTLTLIPTQHNKLAPALASYLQQEMIPKLYAGVAARNWEMTPYVYARNTPDEGIVGFLDLPRYSSGYAAMHHTLSFMPETHMLKPYRDRVRSTYAFLDAMVHLIHQDRERILAARVQAIEAARRQERYPLQWELDQSQADTILFKGYTADTKTSAVSGLDRLYYDRNRPYEKAIPHFNYYRSVLSVTKPKAYVIPQAYWEVIQRLKWNKVILHRLTKDTALDVDFYYIDDYKTSPRAYEGHYLHSQVSVSTRNVTHHFRRGDYVVFTGQRADRYIVETLEPQAPDSYFAWNFFDGILMQKEYFSSYVFEDLAAAYLEEHPDLRAALEARKTTDAEFAASARAQLAFVYENSPYFEPTVNRYPVARLPAYAKLPVVVAED